eukprot:gene3929-biopygen3865
MNSSFFLYSGKMSFMSVFTAIAFRWNTAVSFHEPHESPPPDGPSFEQYENPTGAGLSRANTLNFFVHVCGLYSGVGMPVFSNSGVFSESSLRRSGPNSVNTPNMLEAPGPPLYQKTVGAFAGSFSLSNMT